MRASTTRSRAESAVRARRLLLLLASSLFLVCALGVASAVLRPQSAHALPSAPVRALPGNPLGTDTPTPTTDASPTDTPGSKAPTHTPSSTVSVTATPKSTSAGNGNNNNNQLPPSGAQPTQVANAQPTVGAGAALDASALPGTSGPNGMQITVISSCITTILGLIVAIIAYRVLIRGGYGPFLRTLLLGKRAAGGGSRQSAGKRAKASRASAANYDDSGYGPGYGRDR